MAEKERENRVPGSPAQPNSGHSSGKEKSLIDPIYHKFVRSVIRAIGNTDFYEFFMDAVAHAENEFRFSNRKLEKIVDIAWVDAVEKALGPFEAIVNNPRNVIKEEELIVSVENAKRGGPETIRHLANHAALVEEYHEDSGDVRPGRLMQRYREDTIAIYENRLVYTTLEMAHHFVKIRYDALAESLNEEYGAKLKVQTDMRSATEEVHMDMFLHIKEIDSALETDEKQQAVFARIARLMRVLNVFMNSDFSRQLSKVQRVKGQINQTNVLRKNKNYKAIVALLAFLRNYDDIGYTIKVIEQKPYINEAFQEDIFRNILFNYLILKGYLEDESDRVIPKAAKGRQRALKPKFIHEIIEELTEDYDLPEVEVRKVLIEELTRKQLMQEEAAERKRLVEEAKQRKLAEQERIKKEKEAEKERIRKEKEAERERIRQEKLAAEEKARQERIERELEDRRRSHIFIKELDFFKDMKEEQLYRRSEEEIRKENSANDFADAAEVAEEAEALRQEAIEREKRRRKEAREEAERERKLAEIKAKEERERIEKERAEAEERERLLREAAEQAELEKQIEKDREDLAGVFAELEMFRTQMVLQQSLRKKQEEDRLAAEAERERLRRERRSRTASS